MKEKGKRKKIKKLKNPITFLADDRLHMRLLVKTKDMEISISDYIRSTLKNQLDKEKISKNEGETK